MFNPISVASAVIIAILSLACAGLWKVAGHEREQRAIAEGKAHQWEQTALDCSVATEKAAKAARDAQKRAAKALSDARKGSVATEAEIARLRASTAGTCQAAVADIRKGLKP